MKHAAITCFGVVLLRPTLINEIFLRGYAPHPGRGVNSNPTATSCNPITYSYQLGISL